MDALDTISEMYVELSSNIEEYKLEATLVLKTTLSTIPNDTTQASIDGGHFLELHKFSENILRLIGTPFRVNKVRIEPVDKPSLMQWAGNLKLDFRE